MVQKEVDELTSSITSAQKKVDAASSLLRALQTNRRNLQARLDALAAARTAILVLSQDISDPDSESQAQARTAPDRDDHGAPAASMHRCGSTQASQNIPARLSEGDVDESYVFSNVFAPGTTPEAGQMLPKHGHRPRCALNPSCVPSPNS